MNNRIQWMIRIIIILVGSFMSALAVNVFILPNNLLSGGVMGIAVLLFYLTGFPVGIVIFVLNIPLIIIASRLVSKRFVILSILGITSSDSFLLITQNITIPATDPILAAIFGGILFGTGGGLVLRNRGSLGGTDIVAVMINKFYSFTLGQVSMTINVVILTISAFIFDFEKVLYTLILMFVAIKTIDMVQEGFNKRKTVVIISDKAEEIAQKILNNLHRGVTYMKGEGAFTNKDKKIIYCIVKTMELAKLKDLVRNIDNEAFMSISDTKEVLGKGASIFERF